LQAKTDKIRNCAFNVPRAIKEYILMNELDGEVEVTEEMIDAALTYFFDYDRNYSNERDVLKKIYVAMFRRRSQEGTKP